MTMTHTRLSMNRMNFKLPFALSALIALCISPGLAEASFIPTGGSMTATASAVAEAESNSETSTYGFTPGNYGTFSIHAAAESSVCVWDCIYYAHARTAVDVTLDVQMGRLSLSGSVNAEDEGAISMTRTSAVGSSAGTLKFDVDSPIRLGFIWSAEPAFGWESPIAYLSRDGQVLFSCRYWGCASAPFVQASVGYPFPELAHALNQGELILTPGGYALDFLFISETSPNVTKGSSGTLTLTPTPVPSPASIWLFGSTLLPFFRRRARRTISANRTGRALLSNRISVKLPLALGLLQALCLAPELAEASITPTGGTMTATASATKEAESQSETSTYGFIPGGYGIFNVRAVAELNTYAYPDCAPWCIWGAWTTVDVTLDIQASRISLNNTVSAEDMGSSPPLTMAVGSSTGTLNFDVDAPMRMAFSWSAENGLGFPPPFVSLSQKGQMQFGCSTWGGCASAPFLDTNYWYPTPIYPHGSNQGELILNPGSYELAFSNNSDHMVGSTRGAAGTLTLTQTPVPLPAGFWLFGSALLPFFRRRPRRTIGTPKSCHHALPSYRMVSKLPFPLCVLLGLGSSPGFAEALFVPTGGSMTATAYATKEADIKSETSTYVFIPGNYGRFNVHALAEQNTYAFPECAPWCPWGARSAVDTVLDLQASRISLSSEVEAGDMGSEPPYTSASGSSTGTLSFDVDAPMQLEYSWSAYNFFDFLPLVSLKQNGQVVFACAEWGCSPPPFMYDDGELAIPGDDKADTKGELILAPGSYDLAFRNESATMSGLTMGATGSLALTQIPVPLPASIWLFGSALLPFYRRSPRRPNPFA